MRSEGLQSTGTAADLDELEVSELKFKLTQLFISICTMAATLKLGA